MIATALLRGGMQLGSALLFHPGGDVQLLRPIFTDFNRGAALAMTGASFPQLAQAQEQTPWQRRIFFREGYAFGNACAHALRRRSGNPEGRNCAPGDYRIMQYTGYGFWNGFAGSLHLPLLDERADAWRDVHDYPSLAPFIIGGRSFARVVRDRTVTRERLQGYEVERSAALADAAWHGCGRAVWFRAAAQPSELVRLLEIYPPATSAMALGLGVAMTLTQIASPESVVRTIASMPPRLVSLLKVGVGVALAAMIHENAQEEERVRSLYARPFGDCLDLATSTHGDLARDHSWYPSFVNRMMAGKPQPSNPAVDHAPVTVGAPR